MKTLRYRFHADDYGISHHGANQIIELVKGGNLTSLSFMVNMPASASCAQILFPHKDKICITLHLNILEGYCCSDKQTVPHLVDADGLFRNSWSGLLWKTFSPSFKKELKEEFKCQIDLYCKLMDLDEHSPIRIDSHQHFHIIPAIFKTLCEVIEENHYKVEYIRLAREPVYPFIRCTDLYSTYTPANCLKNLICNVFSLWNIKILKNLSIPYSFFCGLMYSNQMKANYLIKIFDRMEALLEDGQEVEVLFHPGRMLKTELPREYIYNKFTDWHMSPKRDMEFNECKRLNEMMKSTDVLTFLPQLPLDN